MDRNLATRLVLILAIVGVCTYMLYPTYRFFSGYRQLTQEEVAELPAAERRSYRTLLEKSLKLGLDLRGGMHLVLELDDSKGEIDDMRDAQDRVMEILTTRVDKYGVTEPTIARQGDRRILVQLAGVEDPESVRGIVGSVARLEFRMVREPAEIVETIQNIDIALRDALATETQDGPGGEASTDAAAADTTAAKAQADTTTGELFPELLLPETEAPVADTENPLSSLFVAFQAGALYVPDDGYRVERINELLRHPEARKRIPRDAEFMWSSERSIRTADGLPTRPLYMVNTKVELSGETLEDARVAPDPDRPGGMLISFRFNRRGARKFGRVTGENVGKQLAIVLDDVIKSAPNIQTSIPNGEGQITGSYSDQEARDLAIVLRAGALPVDVRFVEERTVGPTLGSDSLRRGLTAGLMGLGLSVVFLVVYYQFAGLLAALGLALNLLIVLAAMATLGAALSLPGIAGLVLSVAMAVDANVLIFERIREELRKNKTVGASIEAGYKNAYSAIIDSNLTTVFAGIVLLYFGTGPIKGFAVTLCIGITASMFTALFVTRFIFDLITHRRKLKRLSI